MHTVHYTPVELQRALRAPGIVPIDIADELGVKVKTVANWVSGRSYPRGRETRQKLFAMLSKGRRTDLVITVPWDNMIGHPRVRTAIEELLNAMAEIQAQQERAS